MRYIDEHVLFIIYDDKVNKDSRIVKHLHYYHSIVSNLLQHNDLLIKQYNTYYPKIIPIYKYKTNPKNKKERK